MPYFSIIIPTYNRLPLLKHAIESVLSQQFSSYEILVVDDGSTDGTWEYLEEIKHVARSFRQKNAGPGSARNLGIRHAIGEFIIFLDSDDLWLPWTLSTFKYAIDNVQGASFVVGRCIRFTNELNRSMLVSGPVDFTIYEDYLSSSSDVIFISIAIAVKTSEIRKINGFIDNFANAEDSDLWLRLGDLPGFVLINNPVVYAYRDTPSSAVKMPARTHDGALNMIHKENGGEYPGGRRRLNQRMTIISRHIRPVALSQSYSGQILNGYTLYRRTLVWHLKTKRFRFIFGFWIVSGIGLVKMLPTLFARRLVKMRNFIQQKN